MIDRPGPWGSGPFALVEGSSTIETERAVVRPEPLACTWLWTEVRTPTLKLAANPHYWDRARGPKLAEVVYRNDIDPRRAVELVCTVEGEVDIVSEVDPADAEKVERSEFAKLVSIDAIRSVVGILDRDGPGSPLADLRARRALDLAVDREGLVKDVLKGYATPLAGLAPAPTTPIPLRLKPPRRDPGEAGRLWREVPGGSGWTLRLAAPEKLEATARRVADDLGSALEIRVSTTILDISSMRDARRDLAGRRGPKPWDILLIEQAGQSADGPPLEFHRAFVGESGEHRCGPVDPAFEELYARFVREIKPSRQAKLARELDAHVRGTYAALPLYSPHVLYAVNKQVDFTPYRTTFELADTSIRPGHWSLRPKAK